MSERRASRTSARPHLVSTAVLGGSCTRAPAAQAWSGDKTEHTGQHSRGNQFNQIRGLHRSFQYHKSAFAVKRYKALRLYRTWAWGERKGQNKTLGYRHIDLCAGKPLAPSHHSSSRFQEEEGSWAPCWPPRTPPRSGHPRGHVCTRISTAHSIRE